MAVDNAVMLEFIPRLPADLQDYVRFLAHEDTQIVVTDAALGLISQQRANRLKRWEEFGRSHPRLG